MFTIFGESVTFTNPWALLLLLLLPIGWILRAKYRRATMLYTVTRRFKNAKSTFKVKLLKALPYIWMLAITFFVIAAARPRSSSDVEKNYTEGIDIVIALDISSSMYAVDFKPKDRIQAAKIEAATFIEGRKNDRIGLVVFASKAFPQCPLTIDHKILLSLLSKVEVGMIEDGTAIGDALITAGNRLRKSEAKSKVIILLTDGRNNAGRIDPVTAAQAAGSLDIKIYAVAMGKIGQAEYPVKDAFGRTRYMLMDVEIDEPMLMQIANVTGGKYFRATNTEKLREIYKEIDAMEKTKVETEKYRRYKELFRTPLTIGLCFMLLGILIEYFFVRQIP